MSLAITFVLPRVSLPGGARPLLRSLMPVAVPLLLGAAEAMGTGLLGRVILSTALTSAEEALRS
ncbi:hypothetical protein [Actinacidiphila oryziradicis]|jgi:hypothetical protein|uniref:hypothetical protein n=1 Tax=Actinacidiphila oryziradicis TaxID=2571141 RepID=UPI0023F4567A|nr:hypothetical protein [Actinacidiphila oryziradicis]MCW2872051.1 hypothetical protein [Actinacidiphila oryziradicis]